MDDRRIIKTKAAIKDALCLLMIEKGFEKITVKDLTTEANINRATFYLHYKDKYDLLEQNENELLAEFEKIKMDISQKYPRNFIQKCNKENLISFLVIIYNYIYENADFMKIILGPRGDLSFQNKFKTIIYEFVSQTLLKSFDLDKNNNHIKYLPTVGVSAQFGIIQKWLEDGTKESPEELACIVSSIILSILKQFAQTT